MRGGVWGGVLGGGRFGRVWGWILGGFGCLSVLVDSPRVLICGGVSFRFARSFVY